MLSLKFKIINCLSSLTYVLTIIKTCFLIILFSFILICVSLLGSFTYVFNEIGVYYYWSGYTTPWNDTKMMGKITVSEKTSSDKIVTVESSGGIQATMAPGIVINVYSSSFIPVIVYRVVGFSSFYIL